MNAKRLLIGTVLALGVVLAPAQVVFAEGETISSAQQTDQTFQQQIQNSMEQVKKAVEVRDRAIQVMADETKAAEEAPQQIAAMIDSLKVLNSIFDDASQFRGVSEAVATFLDQQIADLLADPDQIVREAADSLKARREQVAEIQKSFQRFVDLLSRQVISLTEKRRLCEKLISEGNVDQAVVVAEEALSIYTYTLEKMNSGPGQVWKGLPTE
jgi:hypothetical protein